MGFDENKVIQKMKDAGYRRVKSSASELYFRKGNHDIWFGRNVIHVVFEEVVSKEVVTKEEKEKIKNKLSKMFYNHPIKITVEK